MVVARQYCHQRSGSLGCVRRHFSCASIAARHPRFRTGPPRTIAIGWPQREWSTSHIAEMLNQFEPIKFNVIYGAWASMPRYPRLAGPPVGELQYCCNRCQEQKRGHKHLFLAFFVQRSELRQRSSFCSAPRGAHPSVPTRGFSGPSRAGAVKDGRCPSGSARTTSSGHSLTGPSKTANSVASGAIDFPFSCLSSVTTSSGDDLRRACQKRRAIGPPQPYIRWIREDPEP